MNKHILRRSLALLATAALCAGSLAGCAGDSDTGSSGASSTASASSTPQGEAQAASSAGFPLTDKKVNLKIFAVKSATVDPYDQLEQFKLYEEMTNVHVEWENPPGDNSAERFNLILASGDLPDMFWNITVSQYNQLLSLGVLQPLSGLIDSSAPNFKSIMADMPDTVKYFRDAASQEIYYLPQVDELTTNSPLCLRRDWLDQLGLSEPVTTADWEAYWKGVKEQDLNGNGKHDEIPFSGNDIYTVRSLAVGWGIFDGLYSGAGSINNGFYIDSTGDGKIHYGLTEPKYKEFLTWINRMYAAGYIDTEIASSDSKVFQGKVAENVVGSFRGTLNGNLNTFNTSVAPNVPGMVYMGADPIKGPEGDQYHPGVQPIIRADAVGGVLTKTNAEPEVSIGYMDYFYDRGEGTYFAGWGLKDKTYTLAADGKASFTDFTLHNPDGLSPIQVLGKYCFQNQGPAYSFKDINFAMWHDETIKAYEKSVALFDQSIARRVPTLPFSAEDDAYIRQTMSDIATYTDEMIIKYMLGVESLDNWDAFVSQVQSMDIDGVLAKYNATYELWNH